MRTLGAVMAMAFAAPGASAVGASAQQPNPLAPQSPVSPVPAPQPTTPTVATVSTPSTTSSGGASTGVEVGVVAAALALIGAIAYFIMRDARSVAPVHERARGAPPASSKADRVRRRRARSRAARQQRKRNR